MQKRLISILSILFLMIFTISFNWENPYNDILEEQDWVLFNQDKEKPALSSIINDPHPWQSHNEWKCFDKRDIDFSCAVDTSNKNEVPIISIINNREAFDYEYDLGSEYEWDCKKVVNHWENLMDGEDGICLYGAQMPDLGDENQVQESNNLSTGLWYINQIKTKKGYWKMENYSEFLIDEDAE